METTDCSSIGCSWVSGSVSTTCSLNQPSSPSTDTTAEWCSAVPCLLQEQEILGTDIFLMGERWTSGQESIKGLPALSWGQILFLQRQV